MTNSPCTHPQYTHKKKMCGGGGGSSSDTMAFFWRMTSRCRYTHLKRNLIFDFGGHEGLGPGPTCLHEVTETEML